MIMRASRRFRELREMNTFVDFKRGGEIDSADAFFRNLIFYLALGAYLARKVSLLVGCILQLLVYISRI